jgi:hypothetical protein
VLRAVEVIGGHQRLARYLQVPMNDLIAWMNGHETPPLTVFLKCVDLVLDDSRMSSTQLFWSSPKPREPGSAE